MGALHHRRDTLEPHAGVNGWTRQISAVIRRDLLELHEHQVPDFHEPIPILVGTARRAARNMVAVIVENFRTRPARSGIAHGPEIVAGRDTDNFLVGETGDLLPQIERLIVLGEYGDQQFFPGQAVFLGHQVPGKFDGEVLEVVTEGKIAQHLEKRIVPSRIADILEIIVLAARADAFLRGGGARIGPLFEPGEHVLELDHARIGE